MATINNLAYPYFICKCFLYTNDFDQLFLGVYEKDNNKEFNRQRKISKWLDGHGF